jgi:hypothetical protein
MLVDCERGVEIRRRASECLRVACGDEGLLCADLALRDYAAKLGLVLKIGGINDLGKKL